MAFREKRKPGELTENEKAWLATPEGQRQAQRRASKYALIEKDLPLQAKALEKQCQERLLDTLCKRAGVPTPESKEDQEAMLKEVLYWVHHLRFKAQAREVDKLLAENPDLLQSLKE